MPSGRALATLVATMLTLFPAVASAQSGSAIARAVEALRSSPIYVDEQVNPAPSDLEVQQLRDRINEVADNTDAIYVAVLPDSARDETGGSADEVIRRIGEGLNESGTYLIVVGDTLRAGSTAGTPFVEGRVPDIAATVADERSGDGVVAVLITVIDRLESEAMGVDARGGGAGGLVVLGILLLGVLGLVVFALRRARRRREQERAQVEEVRGTILEDLVSLDAANRDLDNDLRLVARPSPEVQRYALTGIESYAEASRAIDAARRPQDFEPASAAVQEGLYSVAAARAVLEGREVPERRVPCFFDPRHGPSVTEAVWAPPGGQPREVPVCAADAARIADGEEPVGRQVTVGGQRRSYWDAPAYYGPWAGGWYGANTGFLNGLLLGSFLGGPFGGFGWGGGWGGYGGGWGGGYGGDGGGDGGGFGGGDFGGGDFGGGDFGGGDFGGGDF